MATAPRALPHSLSSDCALGTLDDVLAERRNSTLRRRGGYDRASSDSDLTQIGVQSRSSLSVDKYEVTLGQGQVIKVTWSITEEVTASDWIGLFICDSVNNNVCLDQKLRGNSGSNHGSIDWYIDNAQHLFTEATTKVRFRYYHGNSLIVRASSQTVRVNNPVSPEKTSAEKQNKFVRFTIKDLGCNYLKKGMFFAPDPYVKLSIQPGKRKTFRRLKHHGQERKTSIKSSTTCPMWDSNEAFNFVALPTDVLEFEVKDKFAKSRPTISRFLGKLTVPVQRLIDRTNQGATELTFNLMRRNPTDNVSGIIIFNVYMDRSGGQNQKRIQPRQGRQNHQATGGRTPQRYPSSEDQVVPNGYLQNSSIEDESISMHSVDSTDSLISTSSAGLIPESFGLEGEAICHSPSRLADVPSIDCASGGDMFAAQSERSTMMGDSVLFAQTHDSRLQNRNFAPHSNVVKPKKPPQHDLFQQFEYGTGASRSVARQADKSHVVPPGDISFNLMSFSSDENLTRMETVSGNQQVSTSGGVNQKQTPPPLPPKKYKGSPLIANSQTSQQNSASDAMPNSVETQGGLSENPPTERNQTSGDEMRSNDTPTRAETSDIIVSSGENMTCESSQSTGDQHIAQTSDIPDRKVANFFHVANQDTSDSNEAVSETVISNRMEVDISSDENIENGNISQVSNSDLSHLNNCDSSNLDSTENSNVIVAGCSFDESSVGINVDTGEPDLETNNGVVSMETNSVDIDDVTDQNRSRSSCLAAVSNSSHITYDLSNSAADISQNSTPDVEVTEQSNDVALSPDSALETGESSVPNNAEALLESNTETSAERNSSNLVSNMDSTELGDNETNTPTGDNEESNTNEEIMCSNENANVQVTDEFVEQDSFQQECDTSVQTSDNVVNCDNESIATCDVALDTAQRDGNGNSSVNDQSSAVVPSPESVSVEIRRGSGNTPENGNFRGSLQSQLASLQSIDSAISNQSILSDVFNQSLNAASETSRGISDVSLDNTDGLFRSRRQDTDLELSEVIGGRRQVINPEILRQNRSENVQIEDTRSSQLTRSPEQSPEQGNFMRHGNTNRTSLRRSNAFIRNSSERVSQGRRSIGQNRRSSPPQNPDTMRARSFDSDQSTSPVSVPRRSSSPLAQRSPAQQGVDSVISHGSPRNLSPQHEQLRRSQGQRSQSPNSRSPQGQISVLNQNQTGAEQPEVPERRSRVSIVQGQSNRGLHQSVPAPPPRESSLLSFVPPAPVRDGSNQFVRPESNRSQTASQSQDRQSSQSNSSASSEGTEGSASGGAGVMMRQRRLGHVHSAACEHSHHRVWQRAQNADAG